MYLVRKVYCLSDAFRMFSIIMYLVKPIIRLFPEGIPLCRKNTNTDSSSFKISIIKVSFIEINVITDTCQLV